MKIKTFEENDCQWFNCLKSAIEYARNEFIEANGDDGTPEDFFLGLSSVHNKIFYAACFSRTETLIDFFLDLNTHRINKILINKLFNMKFFVRFGTEIIDIETNEEILDTWDLSDYDEKFDPDELDIGEVAA